MTETVEQIRNRKAREKHDTEIAILEHLRDREDYSKGFKLALGLGQSIQQLNVILQEMQQQGLLTSRIQLPPFPDIKYGGGGMARRYYALIIGQRVL